MVLEFILKQIENNIMELCYINTIASSPSQNIPLISVWKFILAFWVPVSPNWDGM